MVGFYTASPVNADIVKWSVCGCSW